MSESDPFERAVVKEARLRQKAASLETPRGAIRLAHAWYASIGLAWLAVVILNWLVFPKPHWIAVLDTIVFALVTVYMVASFGFLAVLQRRRPDWFE